MLMTSYSESWGKQILQYFRELLILKLKYFLSSIIKRWWDFSLPWEQTPESTLAGHAKDTTIK